MQKLVLLLVASCFITIAEGAYIKDTTFPSYNTFSALSRKEITRQFGTDEGSKRIIREHYRNHGWLWALPALILNGGAVYFFNLSAKASTGMASVVGLVLGIILVIPGLISLYKFLRSFMFAKKPSKQALYNKLKEYYNSR